MATKIFVQQNYALVRPIEEEKVTKGGIIIPNKTNVNPDMGVIVDVGPNFNSERAEGDQIISTGDKVAYMPGQYIETNKTGEKLIMVNYAQCLFKIEEDDE